MKRALVFLVSAMSVLTGSVPAAEALGAGVCTISGTITFSSPSQAPTQGRWSIDPAVIDCRGLFNRTERILGPGPFNGSGPFTAGVNDTATCLHHVGSGTVDYRIPTSEQDVHIVEPQAFVVAGNGTFTTPTLKGRVQLLPPYEGDCVTTPVTKALFVAEAIMVRFRPPT